MASILKSKIQYLVFLFFTIHYSLFTIHCYAQSNFGIPSITGKPGATTMLLNYEAIGVNPANLGWDNNNRLSIGLVYVGVNFQSTALNFNDFSRNVLFNLIFPGLNNDNSDNSSNSNNNSNEIQQNDFENLFICNKGLNLSADVTLIGLSLHIPDVGGFGFSIRDRFFTHIGANVTSIADMDTLFKGGSHGPYISSVFKSANVNIQYLREFNLAYGKKIKEIIPGLDLYGGVGYRYILGLANINLNEDDGLVTAETSLNNNNYQDFKNNLKGSLFSGNGHGSAIDLGANAIYLDKYKFGLSLVNIGFITWKSTNLLKVNTNVIRVDSLQKNVSTFNELFNQDNLFYTTTSSTTWLPATLRIGAGMKVNKLIEVGADIAIPLNTVNGYKDNTLISVGGELNIFNFFKINTGISCNPKIGCNIPIGITFSGAGWYDIYIATNDILTFTSGTSNPSASVAFCGIRFNLPPKKAQKAVAPSISQ